MSNHDQLDGELTSGQKLAGNIVSGVCIVLCGLFLLLCGTGVFPLEVKKILLGSLLLSVALVLFITAMIQRNSVSLWLTAVFLLPAVVEFIVKFTSATYSQLYPLYIAIPAVGSLITIIMTREWRDHLYVILFFGIIAAIFALQSSGVASWAVVAPCLVIFTGLLILLIALRAKKDKDSDEQ